MSGRPSVVAFDLSLRATGVAMPDGSTLSLKPGSRTGMARLAWIRDSVAGLADLPGVCAVDLVVIEGYSYASKGASVVDIGEMGGVVRLMLWERQIPYVEVAPSSLKMFATGKGNAGKDDVLAEAIRRLGYAGSSKDEADALWLRAMALHHYGEPVVSLPATHLRGIDKVSWPELGRAA